jgi:hypothetical protein
MVHKQHPFHILQELQHLTQVAVAVEQEQLAVIEQIHQVLMEVQVELEVLLQTLTLVQQHQVMEHRDQFQV